MIIYTIGDAARFPIRDDVDTNVVAHVCNDIGKWGAGFSVAVSENFKVAEEYFRARWKNAKERDELGQIQWVSVNNKISVVNMIAQHGVRGPGNPTPIRYDALEECLNRLAVGCRALVERRGSRILLHMPRIGCGLAGGDWHSVGPIIEETLWDFDVVIYDLG